MFGPSVFGLTFSELISSVFVRAASGRIIFWLFGLRVGSGEEMISGSLPIESGRAQGCFFFSRKMTIWDSGSPPRAVGRAQGCFFSEKSQSGILEALREHWGVLKAVFFLKNSNLGLWKPFLGFWKPSKRIGIRKFGFGIL